MEKANIGYCVVVSVVLHLIGAGVVLATFRQARPRAVGVVEVTLLPMPGARVPDGRAPGDASGTEKPAGITLSPMPTPKGKASLARRPRMRSTRILPPRRDVVAGRVATSLSVGRHLHDGKTGLAWTAPEQATKRAPDRAGPTLRLDPPSTRRNGAGDPDAKPDADGTPAAALGTLEAPDAPLEDMPAPDFDLAGPVPPPLPGTIQCAGGTGSGDARGQRGTGGGTHNRGFLGQGLVGSYYADPQRPTGDYPLNTAFTFPTFTRLVTERVDPAVDFVWDMTSPAPGVPATYFSVRWRGKILAPATADYIFYLDSLDDGARLFVDGEKVAESWMIQQGISVVRAVPLEAGIHDIVVEYCQGPETHASIRLAWSSPDFGKEIIRARPAPAAPRLVAGIQGR